ncbi:hypothetical protein PLICRDRAFT_54674 [Plicaturopsis crispa FD-325 SS-3]|nr:hypothetical protein PLICRDRAFT_54674 [Plicaturopsis crispa FD-325 SS-3]
MSCLEPVARGARGPIWSRYRHTSPGRIVAWSVLFWKAPERSLLFDFAEPRMDRPKVDGPPKSRPQSQ